MPEAASPMPHGDILEADVDAAIAACGGDARATVRALIVANALLSGELEAALSTASRGYARGHPRPRRQPADRRA